MNNPKSRPEPEPPQPNRLAGHSDAAIALTGLSVNVVPMAWPFDGDGALRMKLTYEAAAEFLRQLRVSGFDTVLKNIQTEINDARR